MRPLLAFLFALLMSTACAVHPAPVPPQSSYHEAGAAALRSKTVALVQLDEENVPHAYCSGVWVSGASILTARHCVADAEYGSVLFFLVADDVYPLGPTEARSIIPRAAVLYAYDDAHDLALMRAPDHQAPAGHGVASLRIGTVEPGMFAQAMGQSIGILWWSYSSGDVAAVRTLNEGEGDAVWVQGTTPISPGNSGGGLFDASGALMGICHGHFTRGQALNFWVHPQYIEALLSRAARAGQL